ncbi:Hypothetical protein D9617_12g036860 [Elsinoe fawcettii]|nr:Hypothetical protein D9617_12g036860 [Elsinoe fawcettii]
MSAPRITQFLPLRQLSTPGHLTRQRRNLHMTGPRDFSPIIASRPARIPRPAAPEATPEAPAGRSFNTSRTLKANNDSSTIDFAYLPSFSSPASLPDDALLSRVPIIRADFARAAGRGLEEDEVKPVMKAVISSSSLDSLVSPMSEVSDNSSVEIDYAKVVGTVGSLAGEVAGSVEREVKGKVEEVKKGEGEVGRVWRGLMDDVFGERKVAV